jgi:alkanesulfonate monooxygenase SsuD/methylene tetrahydromethanopterin reductase-like flavin-dependent oxidoreductase (luciferase family)
VLAAIAARTERLRLSTAVTVLSSEDPVRVFQDFATIDGISDGRAEIMAGRGSFTESFPLFGQDLDDYDELFATKLALLLELVRGGERVSWPGTKDRPPIADAGIYPRPVQEQIPVWLAVGGTPQSAVRAAQLELPMMLAIIGGQPERFVPFAALYRESGGRTLGINVHGYIAETSEQAAKEFFGGYREQMSKIGRERGWPPLTPQQYEAGLSPRGHLFVGSPDAVADKIVALQGLFGLDRFMLQSSVGVMPHEHILRSIELFATKVVPRVNERLAAAGAGAPASSA